MNNNEVNLSENQQKIEEKKEVNEQHVEKEIPPIKNGENQIKNELINERDNDIKDKGNDSQVIKNIDENVGKKQKFSTDTQEKQPGNNEEKKNKAIQGKTNENNLKEKKSSDLGNQSQEKPNKDKNEDFNEKNKSIDLNISIIPFNGNKNK